jgi:hypothetical protein
MGEDECVTGAVAARDGGPSPGAHGMVLTLGTRREPEVTRRRGVAVVVALALALVGGCLRKYRHQRRRGVAAPRRISTTWTRSHRVSCPRTLPRSFKPPQLARILALAASPPSWGARSCASSNDTALPSTLHSTPHELDRASTTGNPRPRSSRPGSPP